MKYRLSDFPGMLTTRFGRAQLNDGIQNVLWPVFFRLAWIYRILTRRFTCQVAVIGSLGKTSASRAAAAVLGRLVCRKYYRNFRTPAARRILEVPPWQKYAVTEIGIDGPGQMEKLAWMVKPHAVIVTSVASEHNRSLKNLETTRFEKSKMLWNLPEDGLAIVNGDDPNVLWMRSRTDARVVTYGFDASCDYRVCDYRIDWPHGSRIDISTPTGDRRIRSRLIGRHMVHPLLAAAAFADYAGIDRDLALSRLESLEPASGRLETVSLPGGAYLIRDEFKSSIETIHAALDVLEDVPAKKRGIVLGDISEPPGSQGPLYREIGARVAGIADWAMFYGGKRHDYASGARKAGMSDGSIEKFNKGLNGIAEKINLKLHPGDTVLIKGRSNQKLERISLAIMGRTVECDLKVCKARTFRCDDCPMLESGWGNRKVVI